MGYKPPSSGVVAQDRKYKLRDESEMHRVIFVNVTLVLK